MPRPRWGDGAHSDADAHGDHRDVLLRSRLSDREPGRARPVSDGGVGCSLRGRRTDPGHVGRTGSGQLSQRPQVVPRRGGRVTDAGRAVLRALHRDSARRSSGVVRRGHRHESGRHRAAGDDGVAGPVDPTPDRRVGARGGRSAGGLRISTGHFGWHRPGGRTSAGGIAGLGGRRRLSAAVLLGCRLPGLDFPAERRRLPARSGAGPERSGRGA